MKLFDNFINLLLIFLKIVEISIIEKSDNTGYRSVQLSNSCLTINDKIYKFASLFSSSF